MTWHAAFGLRAPSELLAEGRFQVCAEAASKEISVPLGSEGHECGEAALVVTVRCRPRAPDWAPGSAALCAAPVCVQAEDRTPPAGRRGARADGYHQGPPAVPPRPALCKTAPRGPSSTWPGGRSRPGTAGRR